MRGRIQRALSGFYYVKCADGQLYTCKARGKFRKECISPLVGDDVEFCEVPGGEGRIDEILPRRNSFDRPSVANIDQMVIVCSQAIPKTDPYLVDRMTAIAALKGCDVLICINKCDGDNVDRANLAANQFRNALHLFPMPPSGVVPQVTTYSGYYGYNIDKVWEMIDAYFETVRKSGYFEEKRRQQEKYWMYETINEHLKSHFYNNPEIERLLKIKQEMVLGSKQSSFIAASDVLKFYFDSLTQNGH